MTHEVKASGSHRMWPQWTVGEIKLRVFQAVCTAFAGASTYFEVNYFWSAKTINGVVVRDFPDAVYFAAHGVLATTIVGLGISLCCCSPTKQKKTPYIVLVSSREIQQRGVECHIHQLCEMDTEGNNVSCDLKVMKTILEELKEQNALDTLNAIPSHFIYRPYHLNESKTLFTPLQYWAAKGDLQVVTLLCGYGASDYCFASPEVVSKTTSALYEAAIRGHKDIVHFLLEQGARADHSFAKIVLFSFIPNFVFDICRSQKINDDTLACLKQILLDLQIDNSESLTFQLKIPIDKQENLPEENCIDYLCDKKPNRYQDAIKLLEDFGCQKGVTSTLEELRSNLYSVGTGFTLGELAYMK